MKSGAAFIYVTMMATQNGSKYHTKMYPSLVRVVMTSDVHEKLLECQLVRYAQKNVKNQIHTNVHTRFEESDL